MGITIGFWARFADASAIGSCTLFPSAFADGMSTYVCRKHVACSSGQPGSRAAAAKTKDP